MSITMLLLPWIVLSLAVGYLGRGKSLGFWGFFVFSLIFTPIVGVLCVLVAGPEERVRSVQVVRAPVRDAAAESEIQELRATVRSLEALVQQQAVKIDALRADVASPAGAAAPRTLGETR
jgi:hypothetical protein